MLNRVPFVDDAVHWREEDYWATPAESIGSNGADCEDFSIAKYFLLKELGVPIARLRLTYVKSLKLNQAHMVLAYYARPDAEPLVLDNLEDAVRPASQRRGPGAGLQLQRRGGVGRAARAQRLAAAAAQLARADGAARLGAAHVSAAPRA